MKKLLQFVFFVLLLFGQQLAFSQDNPFVTTWTTTTSPESISIPLNGRFNYDFEFVWKDAADGSVVTSGSHASADGTFTTELPTAGNYLLEITGSFPHFVDYPKASLTDVNQWGEIAWGSFQESFENWPGTGFSATDTPDLSNVTSMEEAFRNASAFNSDLSNWNVSNVTSMRFTFRQASNFNSDLGNWNVGNVEDMAGMLQAATRFNQDIGDWDVRRVTNMGNLFSETRDFNQDIGNWNVRNVTSMVRVFRNTDSFNQDISVWNVSKVTSMREMFFNSDNFNQNLGDWNISRVTDMRMMFDNTSLSPQNYDQTLIGWAPQVDDTTPDVTFGASGLTFCKAVPARQSLLDNGWTINDANTQVCLDETDIVSFDIPNIQATDEVINTADHTITLSVIQSADLATLSPVIALSPGATVAPASNTVQDFSSPVTYTVTAENGTTTQDWTVTITNASVALTDTDILTFDLAEDSPGSDQVVAINLDEETQTITLDLIPFGSLTTITPELTISLGATVNPANGESIDLSTGSFTYTVTAEDGTTTQDWTVNTNVLPSEATDITALTIPGQFGESDINTVNHAVTITYPFISGIADIIPTIEVSREATIDPQSGTAQDFTVSGTNSVVYTVTAQDGVTTQEWTVRLVPASTETDILSFELAGEDQVDNVEIDIDAHTVTLNLIPFGSLTTIFPEIELSFGASITPVSGEEADISTGSGSFTYTVTAEDGITTQDWTINTNVLQSTETDFLVFETPGVSAAQIDRDNHEIQLVFPEGTDLTAVPTLIELSRGASSVPASREVQDFTADVIYTVTAQDGTEQVWTVTASTQRPFITTWDSSGDVTIDMVSGINYNFHYTWRDLNGQIIERGRHSSETDGNFETSLPDGEFTLEILGFFPHLRDYPKAALLDVNQWGNIVWGSFESSFRDWPGVGFSAQDAPDLSHVTNMNSTFRDTDNFNQDLSNWDVSNVTIMNALFARTDNFNGDISNWDVSNVTDMRSIFLDAVAFNNDVTQWQTSSATLMINTFRGAQNFDQDLSGWDISNVTTMSRMLEGSNLSTQNYDNFLISIANQTVQSNVSLGAAGLSHCLGASAVEQLRNNSNWTITDAGESCSSENAITAFAITNIQLSDAVINIVDHTVTVSILASTELGSFAPDITVSPGASISPASGELVDFSQSETVPTAYTVTASDGTAQDWSVSLIRGVANSETDILAFDPQSDQVEEVVLDDENAVITLRLINGGVISSITPTLTISQGATISPANGNSIDLTLGSATYVVTAEDGTTTEEWTVNVLLSNNTDILNFDLTGVSFSNTQIEAANHEIQVFVGDDSDISSILTEITLPEGASISPQAVTVQDFTNPVTYTVTAADGITTQDWIVSVETMRPFITTWVVEGDGVYDLDIDNSLSYDFSFQVKDENGVVVERGNHTSSDGGFSTGFERDGTFTLEIIGDFAHFLANNGTISNLVDVPQWGDIVWESFNSSFRDWPGVDFSAQDVPDLSQMTDMNSAFRDAVNFNHDISNWDVSNVTNMANTFFNAANFNQDLNDWDVSNVTNMGNLFRGAIHFNQNLTNWDVSNVTNMFAIFAFTENFNGDISNWDVSNVTNMGAVFLEAVAFNNDVTQWQTSSATTMFNTFGRMQNFDQDLSGWDISNVTIMDGMLNGSGMSTQNYDKFLISIANQTVQPDVTLDATGTGHCDEDAVNAIASLQNDNGWTINDDGAVCSSENDILAIDIPGLEVGNETIDAVAHTAEITVLSSADLTAISPVFTLSDRAIFSGTSPQSGQTVDFTLSKTNPVAYEVLSSDSTFQTWSVTVVNSSTPLTDTDILTFDPSIGENVNIDTDAHEITFDALITSEFLVTPTLTLSQGASSSPASEVEIDLSDGTEVYTVTAEDGATTQDWTVTVNDLVPANDLCINAIEVSLDTTFMSSTVNATSDAATTPVCGSNTKIGLGVWYKFTGNGDFITISTCDDVFTFDTSISLFAGSCEDGLSCVAGNNDACGSQSTVGFASTAGEEYLILVDGIVPTVSGEFQLTITNESDFDQPTNDECETAETLTIFAEGEGTPTEGNNFFAEGFRGENFCTTRFEPINDVWYRFRPDANSAIDITIEAIDPDLGPGPTAVGAEFQYAIYEECGGSPIYCGSNEEGPRTELFAGDTDYWIQIWNRDFEERGEFSIILNETPNSAPLLFFDDDEEPDDIQFVTISRFAEAGTIVQDFTIVDFTFDEQFLSIISGNEEGIFTIPDSIIVDTPIFIDRTITIGNAAALQASTSNTFNLVIQAADQGPGELTTERMLTVTVIDNDAPVISNTSFEVAENSASGTVIGSIETSDPNGDIVLITGFDPFPSDAFNLDFNTGELTVNDPTLLDFESDGLFEFEVTVEDFNAVRLETSKIIEVILTDVNEAPAVADASFTISQLNDNGSVVGTVTFEEEDANQTHSFTITDGNEGTIFAIDSTSGVISVVDEVALNSNGITAYNLTVQVADNGTPMLSGNGAVTINVVGNNPPAISTDALAVNENSPAGTLIGTIEVTDPDDDQVMLTLANSNSLNNFLLTQDGQLFVRAGAILDFEDSPQIDLEVAATDDGPGVLRTDKTIVIELNNVNEAPTVEDSNFDIITAATDGTVVGTVQAEDPEADQLTFNIVAGNEDGVFAIAENTGVLTI
ncbi:MAG: BspA family leucine-rich repeat surface protein, partial [Bacteroidota bacterium]